MESQPQNPEFKNNPEVSAVMYVISQACIQCIAIINFHFLKVKIGKYYQF